MKPLQLLFAVAALLCGNTTTAPVPKVAFILAENSGYFGLRNWTDQESEQ